MAAALPPGIGNDQQATQATAFIRQQPWYLQWLASKGIRPGPDQQVKLNDDQREELQRLVVAHGIGMNDKYDQIDENGQISEAHHKLRNTLISAGIGAAALTGLGAAGIGPLSGMLGGASTVADLGAVAPTEFGGAASAVMPTLGSMYAAAPAAASAAGGIPAAFGSTAVDTVSSAAPTTMGAVYGAPGAFGSQAVSPVVGGGSKAAMGLLSPGNIWSQIISGGLNLFGAKQASDASTEAARIQADSANRAADLIAKSQADSLAFQRQMWDTQQANMAPWLRTGQSAIGTLGDLMGLSRQTPTAPQPSAPMPTAPVQMGAMYQPGPATQTAQTPAQPSHTRISWGGGHEDVVPTQYLDQYKLLGAEVL